MAKTLLAVDDSVTMRKVLEITFSGEDFTVVTADTSQGAIGKLSENPHVAVIDTVLGAEDGYALAKELRKRSPNTPIIMLASRYAPYDQARGRDAGADDWADKPFDTQQLIDKVKKVMLAKEAGASASPSPTAAPPAAPPAPPAPAAPAAAQTSAQPSALGSGGYRPAQMPAGGPPASTLSRTTQQSLSSAVPNRVGEGSSSSAPGPMPARQAPPAPAFASPPATAATTTAASPQIASSVNGQLAGKLDGLGLTSQQAEAVLALSREVIERVVWEVVPQLAEALIKEEIARLTKE